MTIIDSKIRHSENQVFNKTCRGLQDKGRRAKLFSGVSAVKKAYFLLDTNIGESSPRKRRLYVIKISRHKLF